MVCYYLPSNCHVYLFEICLAPCLISIFAEYLCSAIASVVGEDGVLIQAIMSIKSIIKLDPPSYEKVFL